MLKKKITLVVGARPNFVKAAPLLDELNADGGFSVRLVHTGQHFDAAMSQTFFDQLGMAEPDAYLNINQMSPVRQVAEIMQALEQEFLEQPTDLVVGFGDVNSTLAAAFVANKMELPLAHVEAGLRSFDRDMPEEHNRIVTDMLSDYLFTPSPDADEHLLAEGVSADRIFRVGNIMVDSLLRFRPHAEKLDAWKAHGLGQGEYALVTLHRPANVDDPVVLEGILEALIEIAENIPMLFPAHPRTQAHLRESGWKMKLEDKGVVLAPPLSYLDFLNLMINARIVLTDSGGIQEETTVLGVPCLTLRENTERPITIEQGSNRLVGIQKSGILAGFEEAMSDETSEVTRPDLWDGETAKRILEVLKST
jgi:UDP-N-acetylglucosamine 2-epimerase (non-hydrolysing)